MSDETISEAAEPPVVKGDGEWQTSPHWLFVRARRIHVLVPRWWIITVELLAFVLGVAVRGLW